MIVSSSHPRYLHPRKADLARDSNTAGINTRVAYAPSSLGTKTFCSVDITQFIGSRHVVTAYSDSHVMRSVTKEGIQLYILSGERDSRSWMITNDFFYSPYAHDIQREFHTHKSLMKIEDYAAPNAQEFSHFRLPASLFSKLWNKPYKPRDMVDYLGKKGQPLKRRVVNLLHIEREFSTVSRQGTMTLDYPYTIVTANMSPSNDKKRTEPFRTWLIKHADQINICSDRHPIITDIETEVTFIGDWL